MLKSIAIAGTLLIAAGGLTACNSPGERAVGGAVIGGGSGALIGGALGGRRGALLGAGIGVASGAVIGATTAPQPVYARPAPIYEPEPVYRRPRCPYGVYEDEYGNVYCR
jgi:hypothetical protein